MAAAPEGYLNALLDEHSGSDAATPHVDDDSDDDSHSGDGEETGGMPQGLTWNGGGYAKAAKGAAQRVSIELPEDNHARDDLDAEESRKHDAAIVAHQRQVSSCPAALRVYTHRDEDADAVNPFSYCVNSAQGLPPTVDISPEELALWQTGLDDADARQAASNSPNGKNDLDGYLGQRIDLGPPLMRTPSPQQSPPELAQDFGQMVRPASGSPRQEDRGSDQQENWEGLPLQVQSTPPCAHNSWERVLKKKHSVTLRCRECRQNWKTRLSLFSKCEDFYLGKCALGDKCPNPHIYSRCTERQLQLRRERVERELQSGHVDLWRVCREPVGIRREATFSCTPAPGAHMQLRPGETFAVTERVEAEQGAMFLRLADGRGWVYNRIPGAEQMSCEELEADERTSAAALAAATAPPPPHAHSPGPGEEAVRLIHEQQQQQQQQQLVRASAAPRGQRQPKQRGRGKEQHAGQGLPSPTAAKLHEETVTVRKDCAEPLGLDLTTDMVVIGVSPEGAAARAGLGRFLGFQLTRVNGEAFFESSVACVAIRHSSEPQLTFAQIPKSPQAEPYQPPHKQQQQQQQQGRGGRRHQAPQQQRQLPQSMQPPQPPPQQFQLPQALPPPQVVPQPPPPQQYYPAGGGQDFYAAAGYMPVAMDPSMCAMQVPAVGFPMFIQPDAGQCAGFAAPPNGIPTAAPAAAPGPAPPPMAAAAYR